MGVFLGSYAVDLGMVGEDGKTAFVHIKYSADGGNTFSTAENATYIGFLSDHTQADSNTPSDYTWSLFKQDLTDYATKEYVDSLMTVDTTLGV